MALKDTEVNDLRQLTNPNATRAEAYESIYAGLGNLDDRTVRVLSEAVTRYASGAWNNSLGYDPRRNVPTSRPTAGEAKQMAAALLDDAFGERSDPPQKEALPTAGAPSKWWRPTAGASTRAGRRPRAKKIIKFAETIRQ